MAFFLVPLVKRDSFWEDPFFAENWTGFNQFRRDMLRESREVCRLMHEVMEDEGKPAGSDHAVMPPLRHLLRSASGSGVGGSGVGGLWGGENEISVKEDDKGFQLSLDTHHFKPEQIKVTVDQHNVLKVDGKHEERSEDGNHFSSRLFSRQYKLPDACSREAVVSNLSKDGVLVVSCPKGPAQINGPSKH